MFSCFSDACVHLLSEVHQAFGKLCLSGCFCFQSEVSILMVAVSLGDVC